MMTVFQATEQVERFIKETSPENLVSSRGVIATNGKVFLKCKSVGQAQHTVAGDGWVFSYIYRNGYIDLTLEN